MNTEEIMKLADAYVDAETSYTMSRGEWDPQLRYLSDSKLVRDEARAALEAALSAKQGEQQPVAYQRKISGEIVKPFDTHYRKFPDQYEPLYAGAAPAAQPDTRTVVQQMVDALNIGIAKHYDLAEDVRVGDAIQAGQKLLKELK